MSTRKPSPAFRDQPRLSRVFVVETQDGHALVAFEATSLTEAMQLPKEAWLIEDLAVRHQGTVWAAKGKLRVRGATTDEIGFYRAAFLVASAEEKADLYLAHFSPIAAAKSATGNDPSSKT